MPPATTEAMIPKTARSLKLYLIGASGATVEIEAGADDFTDNREKPEAVTHKSRGGKAYAVTAGEEPDARTGSLTIPFFSEGRTSTVSILDAALCQGAWANESTAKTGGTAGDPYIEGDLLPTVTMRRVIVGAAPDGGDMVYTYPKTHFRPSESVAIEGNTISMEWSCYGTVSMTGPT
jgi:hypothetical protein